MIERREGRSKLVYNKETKRLETVWPSPTHTPTPPPQADREAVREAVTAMQSALGFIKAVESVIPDDTYLAAPAKNEIARLTAAIAKLEDPS